MCRGGPSAHGRISTPLSVGVFPHNLADLPRAGPGRMCSTVRPAPMLHSGLAVPRSPPSWGRSTPIIRFIRSRGPLGERPGQDLTADPDRSSVWAAASLRFDPAQVPNAPRVPCVSVGSGSSPAGLAPGARNGALGGSFRSALDRAAARTAQSRGNSRAHPGRRPERSSQSARTQESPGLPTVLGALRKPILAAT